MSEKMDIYKKMYNVQQDVYNCIKKTSTNSFHNNKYAPLDAILEVLLPSLKENNLFISQDISHQAINCLIFDIDSGESLIYTLSYDFLGKPQDFGSLTTYYKRYQICSIFGIAPKNDDDDGNKSNKLLWGKNNANEATKSLAVSNTFDVFISKMMAKYAFDSSNMPAIIEYYNSCKKKNNE